MIEGFINIKTRVAHKNAYDTTAIRGLDLRAGDTPVFNLYFMLPTRDQRGPYAINRFQSAAILMQLIDAGNVAQASQGTWTELAPSTTAPTITRVVSGTATLGEYDQVTFASEPGSGFYGLVMSSGAISTAGATSATAKVYPGVTLETEIAAAFAAMLGAPYVAGFPSLTQVEVHGNAVATPSRITSVNVGNLQYKFGWTASLDLTGAGVATIADLNGDTPQVRLVIKLTPSGGALETVLILPVNLYL